MKGHNYRVSFYINVDAKRGLLKYSKHWCKREGVDANGLHSRLLTLSQQLQNRINILF